LSQYTHYDILISLQNAGIQFVLVYDLYLAKQFIASNLSLCLLYTSSTLYLTVSAFLLMNSIVIFFPNIDLLITNRFFFTIFSIIIFFLNLYCYCFTLLLSNELRSGNVKMRKTINEMISFELGRVLVAAFCGEGGSLKVRWSTFLQYLQYGDNIVNMPITM